MFAVKIVSPLLHLLVNLSAHCMCILAAEKKQIFFYFDIFDVAQEHLIIYHLIICIIFNHRLGAFDPYSRYVTQHKHTITVIQI